MDYEQKYNEALERAKEVLTTQEGFVRVDKVLLEEIFPELKESEDERIRKHIISVLEDAWQTCKTIDYDSSKIQEDVAWLEKQGEQKPTCLLDNSESNVKFPFKAKVKSNGKIVTIQAGQLSMDCKKWVKYQSNVEDGYMVYEPEDLELVCNIEQKPVIKMKTPEESLGISSEEYNKIVDECIYGDDKSTWGEEDDIILSRIIADYERSNEEWFNAQKSLPHGRKISWLKSLKDKVQPKQEWSEEDEQYFKFIENLLVILQVKSTEGEIKKGINSNSKYYYEVIQWLKSLKNRINNL